MSEVLEAEVQERTNGKAERRADREGALALARAMRGEIESHPDTRHIDYRGETKAWAVGTTTFEIADKMGFDVPQMMRRCKLDIDLVAFYLWFGLLTFDPDLKPISYLSFQEQRRFKYLTSFADEVEDAEGEPSGAKPKTATG